MASNLGSFLGAVGEVALWIMYKSEVEVGSDLKIDEFGNG